MDSRLITLYLIRSIWHNVWVEETEILPTKIHDYALKTCRPPAMNDYTTLHYTPRRAALHPATLRYATLLYAVPCWECATLRYYRPATPRYEAALL